MQILIERRWWRIIFFQENYHCSYLSQRSVNSWMLIRIKKTSTNPSGWVDVFWSDVAVWYFSTQGGPHFVDQKITISTTPCLLLSFSPSQDSIRQDLKQGVLYYHYYLFQTCTHLKWHLDSIIVEEGQILDTASGAKIVLPQQDEHHPQRRTSP